MAGLRNFSRELAAAFVVERGGQRQAAQFLGMNRASFLRFYSGKGNLSEANIAKARSAFDSAPPGLKRQLADVQRAVTQNRDIGRETLKGYADRLSKAKRSEVQAEVERASETIRRAKAGIPPAQELPELPESKRNRSPLRPESEISEYLSEQGILDYQPRNRADLQAARQEISDEGLSALVTLPGSEKVEAYLDGARVGTYRGYSEALDALVHGLYADAESAEEQDMEDLPF